MANEFKVGDKVVFASKKRHRRYPEFYPKAGTVGTLLLQVASDVWAVQWPKGSTVGVEGYVEQKDRQLCMSELLCKVEV